MATLVKLSARELSLKRCYCCNLNEILILREFKCAGEFLGSVNGESQLKVKLGGRVHQIQKNLAKKALFLKEKENNTSCES